MFTVAFVQIVILQGSISAWWTTSDDRSIGSLFLSGLYLLAAVSTLFSPFVAHKIGVTKCLVLCYAVGTAFIGVHLYPKWYLLMPAYALMGFAVGHLGTSEITYLLMLVSKLKFVLSEKEENELQSKLESTKRESLAQKLFRGLTIAQNMGLIAGSLITYFFIQITGASNKNERDSLIDGTCGFESCPRGGFFYRDDTNKSANYKYFPAKPSMLIPCKTSTILAGVFLGFCFVSTAVAIAFAHRIRISYNHGPSEKSKFENRLQAISETFRNTKLKFITPLLIFIGIEQGFMYADFTKVSLLYSLFFFVWRFHKAKI